jgi:regulator of replication initiation timing
MALTSDQHRMLDLLGDQYRQVNNQINQLYRSLDDIRNNMNMVMFSNNLNTNNMNSNTRNSNTNSNRRRTRDSEQHIFYDYNNPINPNIYLDNLASYRNRNTNRNTNTNTNTNNYRTSDMSGLLSSFLNSTVIVRPTNQQIENASRLVSYNEIQNPNSEACAISLERFNPTDQVRQLNHCGHIFLPDEFNEWFHSNVRCPVCRYDIRNNNTESVRVNANAAATGVAIGAASTIRSEPIINNENITNIDVLRNPQTNIVDQVSFDISGNAITNDIMNTITNRLFESLFNPLANTNANANNDHFVYDPSNNILMYETIIHPNNNNNNNDNNRRPQQ